MTAEVVVTATASPAPTAGVGRTVTVLTRADLERLGMTSIIDSLRLVAGVDPKARGGRDVQTDFSLRGATFGQSLVLIDGVRLNDSQSGHHNGEIPAPCSASIESRWSLAPPRRCMAQTRWEARFTSSRARPAHHRACHRRPARTGHRPVRQPRVVSCPTDGHCPAGEAEVTASCSIVILHWAAAACAASSAGR
ncbi:MAG: TonB-dependent receptor [Acidobacteria bacterium]|nr:TonB-dependent receptor [Acidobacteriota bacterium]